MSQSFQAPAGRPYCSQPAQRAREFPPGVSALRASAIVNNDKKWVAGTNLTYYCFHPGDGARAAWQGNPGDLEAVATGFRRWADLGLGMAFTASASTPATARGRTWAATRCCCASRRSAP